MTIFFLFTFLTFIFVFISVTLTIVQYNYYYFQFRQCNKSYFWTFNGKRKRIFDTSKVSIFTIKWTHSSIKVWPPIDMYFFFFHINLIKSFNKFFYLLFFWHLLRPTITSKLFYLHRFKGIFTCWRKNFFKWLLIVHFFLPRNIWIG